MDNSGEPKVSKDQQSTSLLKNFIAGGVGGVCLVAAGHPLDTIKVRLQVQPRLPDGKPSLYSGTFDCIKKTVAKEGVLGLYKGMATPIAGVAPMYAICFFSYTVGKRMQQKTDDHQFALSELFFAGGLAGLATTTILAPGERVKCLLQVQKAQSESNASATQYKGPADCFKQLYKQGGIRNVYVGTLATALRDVPATGMYFMTYEWAQRKLTPPGKSRKDLSAGRTLLAGGTAGILNWLVCIPADVLKSRQQTAPAGTYKGLADVLKHTIAQDGLKGLYKGAAPIMLRAFPANAASFLGYETAMKCLNYLSPDT